jgi:hypothetical protein
METPSLRLQRDLLLEMFTNYVVGSQPDDIQGVIRESVHRVLASHPGLDPEKTSQAFWDLLVKETEKRHPHWSPTEHHTSETDSAD